MIEVKIEEKADVPYIFKTGNLVKGDNSIVLVTFDPGINSNIFEGVSIRHEREDFGEYSDDWNKSQFSQFTGSITLTYKP